jgi:hypothetical protein
MRPDPRTLAKQMRDQGQAMSGKGELDAARLLSHGADEIEMLELDIARLEGIAALRRDEINDLRQCIRDIRDTEALFRPEWIGRMDGHGGRTWDTP